MVCGKILPAVICGCDLIWKWVLCRCDSDSVQNLKKRSSWLVFGGRGAYSKGRCRWRGHGEEAM